MGHARIGLAALLAVAGTSSALADISINQASITGGQLVIAGRTDTANQTVTIDGTEFTATVDDRGTFRLADQAVNYALTTTVRDAPRAGADGAALADLRSLSIPLTITGTVQDYKVRPDVGDLAKARVKQEVEKRRDEVTQKAKDKLKDRLEKLLGR